ncbi:MAG: outer membrane lipoprotein chaperone LolA [Marinicella sp.]
MTRIIQFLLLNLIWVYQLHASQLETKDPKEILTQVRSGLNALSAEFVQYELTNEGQQLDRNTGLVWMQAPNLFRWEYQQPIEQLIVADGQQVWVYDEDLDQVTVKTQDNHLNPIYVIINEALTQQHYDIAFEKVEGDLQWISLTPKLKSDEVKYVWLGIQETTVQQIRVFNHFDQTMVFEFKDIKKNPELNQDLFQFTPPEGVDVIQALGENSIN